MLSEEESSEPGPYSFDRTPYWRFVLDLAADPTVEEIDCLKGAQIGWSELCRNLFGYWADLDPGPAMFLMPDQKAAEDFKDERIDPLVKNTPAVNRHKTTRAWDDTRHRLRLATMTAYFVWAGGKSATKSRPIRYLVCEEPDEFPAFSSTGGDPLSKAEKRLTTYRDKGRAKILLGGTPTTRAGNVWKRWEMCAVRYHFWVPCPHCSAYQLLRWKQIKWPAAEPGEDRRQHAERLKGTGLAYYECEHCKQRIEDHHKPGMLKRGVPANEDQAVTPEGRIVGPHRSARRVGVKISALYSPWVLFGQLASEWIEAQGDPNQLADFINQRLAEPFEEQRSKTEPSFIEEKSKGSPEPMIVPAWARALIATADTQGADEKSGFFYYVIRAWGYGNRSQLIDYGIAKSKAELKQRCLERSIPMEGGSSVQPQMLVIDSGGPRWQEIYEFSQSDSRIHPAKGRGEVSAGGKRRVKTSAWMLEEKPQKKHAVVLWLIDVNQSKDQLHRLIHDDDKTKWLPHSKVGPDYCGQMCAESKIFDPTIGREVWVEIVKDNNHLWDCEHMQCAAAWRMGCGAPEPEDRPADDNRSAGGGGGWNVKTW